FANDVNDLYQLDRYGVRSPLFALAALDGSPTRRWWKRAADGVFPNLYALAGRAAARLAPARAHAAGPAVGTPSMRDPEATLRALGARYGRADAGDARGPLPARRDPDARVRRGRDRRRSRRRVPPPPRGGPLLHARRALERTRAGLRRRACRRGARATHP